MKRLIITIDDEKCNGCGECIPNCPEGALQIIGGKARLVGEFLCDGLGTCIKECPRGAITVEQRNAESYDERQVMKNIVLQGSEVIQAHLQHLRKHNQKEYLRVATEYLLESGLEVPLEDHASNKTNTCASSPSGCPGTKTLDLRTESKGPRGVAQECTPKSASELRQWPIQLHLVSPTAPYYKGADVLLIADCVAYAVGGFHQDYMSGKSIAIACPKLDQGRDIYLEKIRSWFDDARINTLTVITMQVPCCDGLLRLAREAAAQAVRRVPIKSIVVGLQGGVLSEEWVESK